MRTFRRERDIDPAGEAVLGVPRALPVTQQDQGVMVAHVPNCAAWGTREAQHQGNCTKRVREKSLSDAVPGYVPLEPYLLAGIRAIYCVSHLYWVHLEAHAEKLAAAGFGVEILPLCSWRPPALSECCSLQKRCECTEITKWL